MESAWKGLYFKERKMMTGFLVGLCMVSVIFIGLLMFSSDRTLEDFVELMSVGFIIMPGAVLFSLNMEANQLSSFLHNPQSIHKILFAKIFHAIVLVFGYLLLLILSVAVVDMFGLASNVLNNQVYIYLLLIFLQTVIISILPAVILILLWAVHHIVKSFIHHLSIMTTIILLFSGTKLFNLMINTKVYHFMTKWGHVNLLQEKTNLSNTYIGSTNLIGPSFYIGMYIFFGVVTIVLYFISAYLIDRKMEV